MWRRNYFLFRCLHLFAAGLHWSLIIVASCVCVCLSNLFALHNHIHLYCMTIETKQTRTLCNAACNTLSQCISRPLLVSRHWAFWGQIAGVSYCNQELVHCLVLAFCKSSWSSVLKRLVCSHSLTHTRTLFKVTFSPSAWSLGMNGIHCILQNISTAPGVVFKVYFLKTLRKTNSASMPDQKHALAKHAVFWNAHPVH